MFWSSAVDQQFRRRPRVHIFVQEPAHKKPVCFSLCNSVLMDVGFSSTQTCCSFKLDCQRYATSAHARVHPKYARCSHTDAKATVEHAAFDVHRKPCLPTAGRRRQARPIGYMHGQQHSLAGRECRATAHSSSEHLISTRPISNGTSAWDPLDSGIAGCDVHNQVFPEPICAVGHRSFL